jgi:hypothetical protein
MGIKIKHKVEGTIVRRSRFGRRYIEWTMPSGAEVRVKLSDCLALRNQNYHLAVIYKGDGIEFINLSRVNHRILE